LPLDEIAMLEKLEGAELNAAKIALATAATAMLHGEEAARTAQETAKATFEGGGAGEDLPTLSVGDGVTITHALTQLGFTPSNKEAKRKIAEGAVRVNDQVVSDPSRIIEVGGAPVKISLGKKKHGLLVN
jgi:tyrosyl-tRNA synthetase